MDYMRQVQLSDADKATVDTIKRMGPVEKHLEEFFEASGAFKEAEALEFIKKQKAEKRYQAHFKKANYKGDIIYPEMMLDADHAVNMMRALSYLDAQSKSVSVASLVYTQDSELYTSVTITFEWSGLSKIARLSLS